MENDAEIWVALARAYEKVGDTDRAIDYYEKAKIIDNEDDHIYVALGEAYFSKYLKTRDKGFYTQSIENLIQAIELNPKNDTAYRDLGNDYGEEGNLEGAIYCWEKSLELKPDHYIILFNLGLAYFETGNKNKASKYFKQIKDNHYSKFPEKEKKIINEYINKCQHPDR